MADPYWVDVPWENGGGHYDDGQGHVSYDGGNSWVPGGSGTAPASGGGKITIPGIGDINLGGDSASTSTWTGTPANGGEYGTYVKYPDGSLGPMIGNPQAPRSGSTSVIVNPADTTGAWSVQFDANGNGYRINKITGAVESLDFDKTPGTASKESYPGSGVTSAGISIHAIPSPKSPTGYMLPNGTPVNPDGSLYVGEEEPGKNTQVVGSATSGYYERQKDGSWKLVIPGSSSSSSGGGGLSGGSSNSGGGSSTPANRTITNIREGGFSDTNLNISELGPQYMANAAAERGLSGLQSAGGLQKSLSELMDERTNNIIKNLSNPSDIVAREYSTRALGNPQGTATPMYNDTNTLSQIIQRLMSGGYGSGGQPSSQTASPPPSTTSSPLPSTTASPPSSGGGISGVANAIAPVNNGNYTGGTSTGVASRSGVGGIVSGDFAGNDLIPFGNRATRTDIEGLPGYKAPDPRVWYMTGDEMTALSMGGLPVDPRIAAQATDDRQRNLIRSNPQEDPIHMANGGATSGEPFIAGDPQSNGEPNPELVIPEGPSTVVPLQDIPESLSEMLMRTMPRHAYGANYGGYVQEDPNAVAADAYQPAYQPYTPTPVYQPPAPISQTAIQSSPPRSTVPQPVAAPISQTAAQPVPQNTVTNFGDWRDQLPVASSTVPTTTTTPASVTTPVSAMAPQAAPVPSTHAPATPPSNPVQNASNASPASSQPAPVSTPSPAPISAVAGNVGGLGIHPYNGQPADTIMSYPDSAYQNLPSLQFAQSKIPLSTFLQSATGGAPGAFGTRVPYAGDMNYTNMLNIMRIPGAYGTLSSLARSANLSLDDEIAKARMRAPLGNAMFTSGINT